MKKTAYLAVFTVLALALSYLESLVPLPLPFPGVRLGLSNIVILFLILYSTPVYGLFVLIAKVLLSSLLFGNIVSCLYSVVGGLFAFGIMVLLKLLYPRGISVIGISVGGAAAHSIGQIAVAILITSSYLMIRYLAYMLLISVISGILTGILCILLKKLTDRINIRMD